MKNLWIELQHQYYKIKYVIHHYYWQEFNYTDNVICMHIEKMTNERVARWLAFHCYMLMISTLSYIFAAFVNKYVDIPMVFSFGVALGIFVQNNRYEGRKKRIANGGLQRAF